MTYFTTNSLVIFSFCLLFIAGVKFLVRRVLHILIHRRCFYKNCCRKDVNGWVLRLLDICLCSVILELIFSTDGTLLIGFFTLFIFCLCHDFFQKSNLLKEIKDYCLFHIVRHSQLLAVAKIFLYFILFFGLYITSLSFTLLLSASCSWISSVPFLAVLPPSLLSSYRPSPSAERWIDEIKWLMNQWMVLDVLVCL